MTQQRDNLAAGKPPRPRFPLRACAIVLIVVSLPVIAADIFSLSFNPGRYTPLLVAALSQATGRSVRLTGPVNIDWSLTPSLQMQDFTISDPPGFPGPEMLTVGTVRAEIALLPLLSHKVDILRLVLISPHLVLEHRPDGATNWDFSPADERKAAHPSLLAHSRYKIAIEAMQVENGLLTINTGSPSGIFTIQINSLTGTAASLATPLHLTAQAKIGTTPFTLSGLMGPIERFSGIGTSPWPLNLDLTFAGAKLNIAGAIEHPRSAKGYSLALNLVVPNLATLGQALPAGLTAGLPFPPVQNLTVSAQISDSGAALPAIDHVSVEAGPSDLSAFRPGLALGRLDIAMASLEQPVSLTVNGSSISGAFSIQGQFGAPDNLINPAFLPPTLPPTGSFPLTLTAQWGAATANITGNIATPQTLAGAALALTASIPDLSAFSQTMGIALPAWKHISLQTNIIDPGGQGFYNAIGLDSLTASMDNAAFGGAASFYLGPQPRLQISLSVSHANIDALSAALPPPPLTPSPVAPPQNATNTNLIPDTALHLGLLKTGNADIQFAADNVTWQGSLYTALQMHAGLTSAVLTIDQLTGELPGGTVSGTASINTTTDPATESLQIKAPALALAPLLAALHLAGTAEGTLQAQFSASSTGDTPNAIAANLSGQFGLASVNDVLSTSLLSTPLAKAGLPIAATPANAILRCLAIRINANKGVASLQTFTINSDHISLHATGSADLGQESYDIMLHPANGVSVQWGGSFVQPNFSASGTPAAIPAATSSRPDACPAALALARFGQPGPAAAPLAAPELPSATPIDGPKNLLNSLLGP